MHKDFMKTYFNTFGAKLNLTMYYPSMRGMLIYNICHLINFRKYNTVHAIGAMVDLFYWQRCRWMYWHYWKVMEAV